MELGARRILCELKGNHESKDSFNDNYQNRTQKSHDLIEK